MKEQKECTYCGSVYDAEDMYLLDGDYYCFDCAGVCECCGSATLYSDMTVVNDGTDDMRYICCECLDSNRFFQCRNCGDYYTTDRLWGSYQGEQICEHCSDNYEVCDHCDNIFLSGELEYCSQTEEYLCSDCMQEVIGNMDAFVHDYSYKPNPIFFGESNTNCFLGIELEVDSNGEYNPNQVSEAAEYLIDTYDDRLYLKHDGSLTSGFEIVSHPCTPKYHFDMFEWENIMEVCKSHTLPVDYIAIHQGKLLENSLAYAHL